jgi:predicted RNase H-like HicB family nuclease
MQCGLECYIQGQQFEEPVMKLRVVLEPSDEGGFTAHVPSLPGCVSEGDSKEEALSNIKEAIQLYLEPVEDDWTYGPDSEIEDVAV